MVIFSDYFISSLDMLRMCGVLSFARWRNEFFGFYWLLRRCCAISVVVGEANRHLPAVPQSVSNYK